MFTSIILNLSYYKEVFDETRFCLSVSHITVVKCTYR